MCFAVHLLLSDDALYMAELLCNYRQFLDFCILAECGKYEHKDSSKHQGNNVFFQFDTLEHTRGAN